MMNLVAYLHCRTQTRESDAGTDISVPKMGTVKTGDPNWKPSPSLSLYNWDSFCAVQCSHGGAGVGVRIRVRIR